MLCGVLVGGGVTSQMVTNRLLAQHVSSLEHKMSDWLENEEEEIKTVVLTSEMRIKKSKDKTISIV